MRDFTLYLTGGASSDYNLRGTQMINNQVYSLENVEEFDLCEEWPCQDKVSNYLSSILIMQGDKNLEFKIDEGNIIEHEDEFFGKAIYYLENEDSRMKIVNNAYEHFVTTQSWRIRSNQIKNIIGQYTK